MPVAEVVPSPIQVTESNISNLTELDGSVKDYKTPLPDQRGPLLVREATISFVPVMGGNMTLGRIEDGETSRWYFRPSAAIGADAGVSFTFGILEPVYPKAYSIDKNFEGKDWSMSAGAGPLNFSRAGNYSQLFEWEGTQYTINGLGPAGGGFGGKMKIGIGGQYNWGKSKVIDQ